MPDRDEQGHFLKGHSLKSPGRKRRSTEERYLRSLTDAVSMDDWQAIIQKAIEQATGGDKDARTFLANYLIGKPTEYVAADVTSNGEGLRVLIQYADDHPNDTEAA